MKICFGRLSDIQQARYEAIGLPKGTTITRYTTDILPARTMVNMGRFLDWHREEDLPARLEKATTKRRLEPLILKTIQRQQRTLSQPGRDPIERVGSTAVDIWFHLKRKTPVQVSDLTFAKLLNLMKAVKAKAEALAAGK